jgi:3-oxoadipate enol-lactonase
VDVSASRVELHAEAHGQADASRPPVVLLHGLGSSSRDWALQVGALGERHSLLAVDLRGHGRSPSGRGRVTIEAMAGDVSRALDARRMDSAHLVGLSLGGCVALTLAVRQPARVRSLTVVNAFARFRPAGPRGLFRGAQRIALLCTAPMPVVARHVARDLFPRPEQETPYVAAVDSLSRTARRVYLRSTLAVLGFDLRRELASVRCPTLVIVGARDRTVSRGSALALAGAIPGARLEIVPDSGHATPYDQPDLFNRLILEFLDGVG